MIKTLNNIFRQDREKFVVPKSVQQAIPIQTVWNDGIFKVGRNKFSRSYRFPVHIDSDDRGRFGFVPERVQCHAAWQGNGGKQHGAGKVCNGIGIPENHRGSEDIFFLHGNGTDGAFCKAWLKMRGDGCHGQAAGIA